MQESTVVSDDRGFSEYDARGVVDHYSLPHRAARVNVHSEDFGYSALNGERQRPPVLLPENVPDAARLQAKVAPAAESHARLQKQDFLKGGSR